MSGQPESIKVALLAARAGNGPIVPSKVAAVAANEMNRLWQAHGIIELAVHAIGVEVDNGRPAIKEALQGAADIIFASINALEPICIPGKIGS